MSTQSLPTPVHPALPVGADVTYRNINGVKITNARTLRYYEEIHADSWRHDPSSFWCKDCGTELPKGFVHGETCSEFHAIWP